MDSLTLTVGTTLRDRYRIDMVLGSHNGVSEYLASDLQSHSRLFVRQVRPAASHLEESRKRRQAFRATAEAMRHLHHPALPTVLECFDEGPDFYTIFPLAEAPSLRQVCSASALNVQMVSIWLHEILDAMEAIAESDGHIGLPDLNPDTILIREDGTVLLQCLRNLDEGVHYYDPQDHYLAPDAGRGLRSDLYSLGAVAYFLLTGVQESVEGEPSIEHRDPPPPAARFRTPTPLDRLPVAPALQHWVESCMALQRFHRPHSPAQARRRLRSGGPTEPHLMRRPSRRRAATVARWTRASALFGILLVVGLLGLLVSRQVQAYFHARTERQARESVQAARDAFQQSRWRDVLDRYTEARTVVPLDSDDIVRIAEAHLQLGDAELAKGELRTLLERDKSPHAYAVLYLAYRDLADKNAAAAMAKASQLLAERVRSTPRDAEAHFRLAQIALSRHWYMKAQTHVQAALKAQPGHTRARSMGSELLRRQGLHREAVALLRQVPEGTPPTASLNRELGLALMGTGQVSEGLTALQAAIELGDRDPECMLALAETWLWLDRPQDARGVVKSLLRVLADDPRGLTLLGRIELADGHPKAAGTAFTAAWQEWRARVRKVPGDLTAWVGLGQCLLGMGQPAMARDAFHQGLILDPHSPQIAMGLAAALDTLGVPDAAAEVLTKVRTRGQGLWTADLAAARMWMRRERLDHAETLLKAGLIHAPDSLPLLVALGECRYRARDYNGASRQLARVIQLDPSCVRAYDLLGACELETGNGELAALHYERLSSLQPEQARYLMLQAIARPAAPTTKAVLAAAQKLKSVDPHYLYWKAAYLELQGEMGPAERAYRTYIQTCSQGMLADAARLRLDAIAVGEGRSTARAAFNRTLREVVIPSVNAWSQVRPASVVADFMKIVVPPPREPQPKAPARNASQTPRPEAARPTPVVRTVALAPKPAAPPHPRETRPPRPTRKGRIAVLERPIAARSFDDAGLRFPPRELFAVPTGTE